jgi:hypothetical protein
MSEGSQELTFTFQLRGKPIEVHVGGENELHSEIVFESPTSKNMREVSQLKQSFSRALMEVQERNAGKTVSETDKTAEDITGEDLMQMAAISSEPLEHLLEIGHKLLVSGVGKVAGQKFSSTMMQDVSCDELERMVGEYCRVFILRSFLK